MNRYFDADKVQVHRDQVVTAWLHLSRSFSTAPWTASRFGHTLDFSLRAKQALALSFERCWMLHQILKQEPPESRLLDTLHFRLLRRLEGTAHLFPVSRRSRLSFLNQFLDWAQQAAYNAFSCLRLLKQMAMGMIIRVPFPVGKNFSLLWDAANGNEFSLQTDERYFSWIIDGKKVTKENVFFLLWKTPSAAFRSEIAAHGLTALTLPDAYRGLPISRLALSIVSLMKAIGSLPFAVFSWTSAMKTGFLLEIQRYEPLLSHFNFRVYVGCNSQFGHEGAHFVFLAARGVRSLLYCYSANSYLGTREPVKDCRFRNIAFTHVMADEVIVWHRNYADFIESHEQPHCRVRVLGPLMPGDESAMFADPETLRRALGLSTGANRRFVTVFDVAAIARNARIPDIYPNPYTDDYVRSFLDDMIRLVSEFENLFLIYKPKRNLMSTQVAYSEEFRGELDKLVDSGRGFVLKEEINPWIPVKLGDICIGLPFTSPVIAAAHYGKDCFFHDPSGAVAHLHRYAELGSYITYGYDSLRERVRECLTRSSGSMSQVWKNFIGDKPVTNTTDEFRSYLVERMGAST